MLAAQLLVNAAALGAAYALIALGFVLVLKASGAVNFAHGDMVMAGGFLAVALASLLPADIGVPGLILLPLTMALMGLFGLIIAWIAVIPLRGSPPSAVFISTIAVGIVLANGANALFGAAPRAAPPLAGAGMRDLAGVTISSQSLAVLATAAALGAGLGFLLHRTQLGRKLRAVAEDAEMARALGIPAARMIGLSFALAAALAGAAGLLLSYQFFITPFDGGPLMLKAYIATTIGGWGSLRGAALGAFLIALFEVAVAALVSQPVAEGLLYVVLFVVLALRPQGLFGEAAQIRA